MLGLGFIGFPTIRVQSLGSSVSKDEGLRFPNIRVESLGFSVSKDQGLGFRVRGL